MNKKELPINEIIATGTCRLALSRFDIDCIFNKIKPIVCEGLP
jgi:hypothetical protein